MGKWEREKKYVWYSSSVHKLAYDYSKIILYKNLFLSFLIVYNKF